MSDIEDRIYNELSRNDEWVGVDGVDNLRSKLFGTDEWSGVREAEWMDNYRKKREQQDLGGCK